MKKILIIGLVIITTVLTGCDGETSIEFIDPSEGDYIESRDRYTNVFDETQIPSQWEQYGIGDPYVLRHNGVYYLYASTKDGQIGIRAWQSSDLVNWTIVDNETLSEGYVSEDEITVGAYAPEVIYWDGIFYMYTSPGGQGHYVLTSESPIGPFEKATENFGESIDGSVFIDDNEQMYFLRAFSGGIRMVEMSDPLTLESGITLDNTSIGGWTEGPTIIKRDDIYYLTFTGTNVISSGYRVNYATATELGTRDAFTSGNENPILLSTDDSFKGIGHSSTVLGPNLDSYYIVYHNLNSAAGPNRSFNINRLLFNGSSMTVNGAGIEENIVPELSLFESIDGIDNYIDGISNSQTDKSFTAEFNFVGQESKLLFGYVDENNYNYVSFGTNSIELHQLENGVDTIIGTGTLVNNFDFSKLHTIRVVVDNGDVSVMFDNMTKISHADLITSAGSIGYKEVTEMYYSSFSNHSYGSSDNVEPKKENIFSNLFIEDQTNGVTLQDNPNGSYDLEIAKGGYASYIVDVSETGLYSIFMDLNKASLGSKFMIQIDEGEPYNLIIPEVDTDSEYINTMVGEIEIPMGIHQLKIIALDDPVIFNSITYVESSMSTPSYINSLEEYIGQGVEYVTLWKVKNGGHHAIAGNRQLLYIGDETIQDFHLSIDMEFIGETASSTAGILIKGSNPALDANENYDSIVGYYVGFNNNRAFINRYNYNLSDYTIAVDTNTRPESGVVFNVDIYVSGNTITVFVDDQLIMEYTDHNILETGRIGLYTEGAEVLFSNLEITYD